MVGVDGRVHVLDVGVGAAASAREPWRSDPQRIGYFAPEQIDPRGVADARTDVFALGVVLWEALGNRRLFPGNDAKTARDRVQKAAIVRLDATGRSGVPGLATDVADLIAKALERDPSVRFQTAEEMANAVGRLECADATAIGAWVTSLADVAIAKRRQVFERASGSGSTVTDEAAPPGRVSVSPEEPNRERTAQAAALAESDPLSQSTPRAPERHVAPNPCVESTPQRAQLRRPSRRRAGERRRRYAERVAVPAVAAEAATAELFLVSSTPADAGLAPPRQEGSTTAILPPSAAESGTRPRADSCRGDRSSWMTAVRPAGAKRAAPPTSLRTPPPPPSLRQQQLPRAPPRPEPWTPRPRTDEEMPLDAPPPLLSGPPSRPHRSVDADGAAGEGDGSVDPSPIVAVVLGVGASAVGFWLGRAHPVPARRRERGPVAAQPSAQAESAIVAEPAVAAIS